MFHKHRNLDFWERKGDIPLWAISERISPPVHENTLSRWLRTELSEEKRKKVFKAIEEIKNNMKADQ